MAKKSNQYIPDSSLTMFKLVTSGSSNIVKVSEVKVIRGFKQRKPIPLSILTQLYIRPSSAAEEIAHSQNKEYMARSGYMVMHDETVPALATYSTANETAVFKVCTFLYNPVFAEEQGYTKSDFLKGINYLFESFVNAPTEDEFYLFAVKDLSDRGRELVRLDAPIPQNVVENTVSTEEVEADPEVEAVSSTGKKGK
jgi:hypothetical protein